MHLMHTCAPIRDTLEVSEIWSTSCKTWYSSFAFLSLAG